MILNLRRMRVQTSIRPSDKTKARVTGRQKAKGPLHADSRVAWRKNRAAALAVKRTERSYA